MTPEETRQDQAAQQRRYRERRDATETQEERERRLAKEAAERRADNARRREQETPEERAARQRAKADYMRAYNARKKAERVDETPEEREARRQTKLEWERKHRAANRESLNAKQRERRANDRERFRATNRRWYANHRETAYLAGLDAGKRYRVKVRLETLRAYGGETPSCRCCGESTLEFLALDHVNGGGNAHRKSIRPTGVASMYEWAKRNGYPKGMFQVLCHNCNMAKGFYGACPHNGDTG